MSSESERDSLSGGVRAWGLTLAIAADKWYNDGEPQSRGEAATVWKYVCFGYAQAPVKHPWTTIKTGGQCANLIKTLPCNMQAAAYPVSNRK